LKYGILALGAGLVRLFFVDSYMRLTEWYAEGSRSVSVYVPVFNERTLIYFIGAASLFTVAYFAFYRNEKQAAKILGLGANAIILF
jgi:hypothetical protein